MAADDRVVLQFSNCSLRSFKRRNEFKLCNAHGESADVEQEEEIECAIVRIQNRLAAYALSDVWSADEFGLF